MSCLGPSVIRFSLCFSRIAKTMLFLRSSFFYCCSFPCLLLTFVLSSFLPKSLVCLYPVHISPSSSFIKYNISLINIFPPNQTT